MTQSPTPSKPNVAPSTMNFFEALRAVTQEQRVTKLEWGTNELYLVLHGGFLKLHKTDGKFYSLSVSEADLAGEDYVIL